MSQHNDGRGTALALPRRTALSADMNAVLGAPEQLDQTMHLLSLIHI